jgi:hypothetical protein
LLASGSPYPASREIQGVDRCVQREEGVVGLRWSSKLSFHRQEARWRESRFTFVKENTIFLKKEGARNIYRNGAYLCCLLPSAAMHFNVEF